MNRFVRYAMVGKTNSIDIIAKAGRHGGVYAKNHLNFSSALFIDSSSFFSKRVVLIMLHEKLKTKARDVKSHGSFELTENHPQSKIIITKRIKHRTNKII